MRLAQVILLPLVVLALLACGCRSREKTAEIAAALQQRVAGKPVIPVSRAVWTDVRAFYEQREFAPAWSEHKYASERSADALVALRSASAHGFPPEEYGERLIVELHDALAKSEKNAPDRMQRLADFDLRVTTALLALGRDVALGRTTPERLTSQWKSRRTAPDLAGTLASALDGDLTDWLEKIRPPHPEYVSLQKALADLRGQKEKGGWPPVPAGSFKPGQSDAAVAALGQRLAASGQLSGEAATSARPVYDDRLRDAVRSFQELHAIKATGLVDAATLAALNVPTDQRIQQVALNLERWRWMPDDLGPRHFFVNVPYYHLIARENGKPVMDIRVVVGKPGNETPIFSDEMEVVVFSPYWNIPDSIVNGEMAPAVAQNPGYLARNNIEVLRVSKSGAARVDPGSVNWGDPGELRQLAFRQRPGASNALGHVKFLFPNDFDVYLHDTPADSLFERPGRAFSHGCIRVEEPEVLAKYVLRDYAEWDGPRILGAMHSGNEQHVKLKEKIPVHVGYFTSWVDEAGGLHFQPDIYGYDARQAAQQPTGALRLAKVSGE